MYDPKRMLVRWAVFDAIRLGRVVRRWLDDAKSVGGEKKREAASLTARPPAGFPVNPRGHRAPPPR
jgi:hypothetical protein